MPTTTNFGWTTPADTDLVKDGAAAIRTLAGNIDTSLVDLKGGTTGQYLQKNSNTDLDYIWAAVSAGGMTLLETLSLSGSSVTSSSIAATYTEVFATFTGIYGSNNADFYIRCNSDTGSNYDWAEFRVAASSLSGEAEVSNAQYRAGRVGTSSTTANTLSGTLSFPNYTSTGVKIIQSKAYIGAYAGAVNGFTHAGAYRGGSAISTITILPSGGTFTAGEVKIYGVK
jgi:hypothetical protein